MGVFHRAWNVIPHPARCPSEGDDLVQTEPLLDENAAPPPEKPQPSNDPTKGYPKWLGNAALLVLVFQNTCLIMTMKYASQTKAADGGQAVSSTMVVLVRTLKPHPPFCFPN